MKKLSLSFPTILIKRDAFQEERTYRAVEDVVRAVKDSYLKISNVVNQLYDGNISPDGGTTANRPASPRLYQMYYDTTISKLILWDGTNWVDSMGTIS